MKIDSAKKIQILLMSYANMKTLGQLTKRNSRIKRKLEETYSN